MFTFSQGYSYRVSIFSLFDLNMDRNSVPFDENNY